MATHEPPGGYPEPQQQWGRPLGTSGFAIASLVLGIVWAFWIGSILALIFGYVALRQVKRSEGWLTGRGMAIAGIVLGWVGIGFLALTIALGIFGYINSPNHDYGQGKCVSASDEVVPCDGNEWGLITSSGVDSPSACNRGEYYIRSGNTYYCVERFGGKL
ncbi:MAG: DUF4190 domain-containing protein [Actinomycetota bacterium]|nr:DUF4190 domain-containing protein [Actinomycetota bacterium]